jgi:hypothetical protein
MGDWKIQVSVRVSQALRAELERYAAAEKRTLGNFVYLKRSNQRLSFRESFFD